MRGERGTRTPDRLDHNHELWLFWGGTLMFAAQVLSGSLRMRSVTCPVACHGSWPFIPGHRSQPTSALGDRGSPPRLLRWSGLPSGSRPACSKGPPPKGFEDVLRFSHEAFRLLFAFRRLELQRLRHDILFALTGTITEPRTDTVSPPQENASSGPAPPRCLQVQASFLIDPAPSFSTPSAPSSCSETTLPASAPLEQLRRAAFRSR